MYFSDDLDPSIETCKCVNNKNWCELKKPVNDASFLMECIRIGLKIFCVAISIFFLGDILLFFVLYSIDFFYRRYDESEF